MYSLCLEHCNKIAQIAQKKHSFPDQLAVPNGIEGTPNIATMDIGNVHVDPSVTRHGEPEVVGICVPSTLTKAMK